MAIDERERARTQALCWLLDELFDAEEDLLSALDRGAIGGWRRERLGEFCGVRELPALPLGAETTLAGRSDQQPDCRR